MAFLIYKTMKNSLEILEQNLPTLSALALSHMPGKTKEEAEHVAMREIANYAMLEQMNSALAPCTQLSKLLLVKQVINDNLSLSQSAGLVYVVPSKVKTGITNGVDTYDWIVTYDPTSNGRLSIAYQAGTILDHKRPEIKFDDEGIVESVTWEYLLNARPSGRWEKVVFDRTNFLKWQRASAAKNKGNANANYTNWNGGIDPEFAGTKSIRHGLKKLGTNINAPKAFLPNPNIKFEPIESVMKEAKDELEITEHEEIQITTHEIINTNPDDL
jgi:hypothetical protein